MLCVILKMKNGKVLNNNILEIPLNFSNLFTNQKVYVDTKMKNINFPCNTKSTEEVFVGQVWTRDNINEKSGIAISFQPIISSDITCFSNLCYPEGFAFVFTSNPYNQSIGRPNDGLGYVGIFNAIAFEFDYIYSSYCNDMRKPHFSIHYNLTGDISSKSPKNCKICNKELPNNYVI